MRKKLTFIILCCLPLLAGAQNINFVDANVKVLCVANWDTDKDGELSKAEAAAVTDLGKVFNNTNITSFNELKYFTGLISIGYEAFRSCGSLTSIDIPNSVTSIGECAFGECNSLTSFVIPNSVTSIGNVCFYRSGITSIIIPKNVSSIGEHIFFGCQKLTSVIVDSENPTYDSRDNCNGIIETASNTLIAPCTTTFIPNTVTSFGNAFDECYLTTLSIPNSITTIDGYAFICCFKLESITVSSSVTSIANGIFLYCGNIVKISVDSENPVYDSRDNCNAIIETASNTLIAGCPTTVIPNTVTAIGGEAFRGTPVTSITIPSSVVDIDWSSFWECHQLKSIIFLNPIPGNFPETIGLDDDCIVYVPKGSKAAYEAVFPQYIIVEDGEIYTSIFTAKTVEGVDMTFKVFREREKTCMVGDETYGSPSIPNDYKGSVTIPSMVNGYKVTRIGSWAFNDCSGLTSVSIPETVSSIGANSFRLTGITEIEFPNSLESIENGAFQDCGGLTSIIVPKSVTHIDPTAFEGKNISSITVEDSNPVYDSRDNCNAIIESATNTLVRGCKNTLIPQSVTALEHSCFSGCPLVKIVIPESVTTIGDEAFVACRKLSEVNIPNSVTQIKASTFRYCEKLTTIVLPEDITYIGEVAFSESGLKSITFPKNFPTIEEGAFWCGLTSVTTYMETPVTITKDIFPSRKEATLYVPKGCKATYMAANYWKEFKEIKEIMNVGEVFTAKTVEGVDMTFKVISEIEKTCMVGDEKGEGIHSFPTDYSGGITIPSTANGYKVTRIGSWAFNWCGGLTSVNIPETVTSIGYQAFIGTSIREIDLPNSLERIEDFAFECCYSLISIFIPKNVTSIGYGSFEGCLNSIVVDSDNPVYDSRDNCNAIIKTATNELIKGCKNTIIPKTVTKIGILCFSHCGSSFTSVVIPESIRSIDSGVFHDNDNLTEILSLIKEPMALTFDYGCWNGINPDEITLYVPKRTKEQYEATEGWSVFKNIIEKDDAFFVDNAVYINDTLARQGRKMTLSLKMKNTVAIRGFQFDLYLPEGVTVAKNSKGKILGALSDGRLPEEDEHTLSLSEQPDGAIRFLCSSQYDETFTGNDGEIATLQVNIAEGMADGDYLVQLKNMKLTESDIDKYYETDLLRSYLNVNLYVIGDINRDKKVDVSDYTGVANHIHGNTPQNFFVNAADVDEDGIIDVSDYTGIANIIHTGNIYGIKASREMSRGPKKENTDVSSNNNVIYVEPFAVTPGTQTTISFKMKNTAEIRGFQFDLYLPEGVTVVKSAKGRIQGALSAGRLPEDDEHDLTFSEQQDGAIRFLCSSQYDETFTGNDGEIATLQVNVAENISDGNYPVVLKHVKLTETDISKFYVTEEVESTMSVLSTAEVKKGDVNNDTEVDSKDVTVLANYLVGRGTLVNEAAAYVNDDDRIDVADLAALIKEIIRR